MGTYLINYNDNPEFNMENVTISRKLKFENGNYKYYIYYMNDNKLNELYIRLPRIRLIYNNFINPKFKQISLPLFPNWGKINDFIKFISNLETDIFEQFNKKHSNLTVTSLLKKDNNIVSFKMHLPDKVKITSQNGNYKYEDFKINSEIDIVIKMSYIWLTNDSIGLSSQLYQIKYYPPPEQFDFDFIDEKVIIPNNKPLSPKITPSTPSTPLQQPESIPSQPKKAAFVPSIFDIKNAIKKLKPFNNTDESGSGE